ncbi:MAG: hypothetical protein LBC20_14015 [Planctomycetaceae bacterium]|nr:hypothetical protein [Planctomycetaceae bacterium]
MNNRNSTVFGQSANEKINLGIIGCGGRGRQLLGDFVKRNDINILYCCDAQGNRAEQALKIVADSPLQQTPKPYEVPDNI